MSRNPRLTGYVLAVLLSAATALPPRAGAQTTGTLRGQVTDPSAAVVPGATVRAEGNGISRTATTDAQGRYTLTVPAGDYSLTASARGFVTWSRPAVSAPAGQVNALDIALTIALENQQVQVNDTAAGQVSTDPSANAGALVLKNEDLETLPDDPDDLQSDLEALAGPAAGPNGAQFFVDGFSGGQLPPKSSIREIRINSNPFASEFDRPGFGRVEILTRPGSDQFHGMAFLDYGDRILDSRNPIIVGDTPGYSSRLYNGNFGGPLTKKSSFLIDFNRRQIDEGALINARYLTDSLQQALYNGAYPTPQRYWSVNSRLDYQLNANNTLAMRYQHLSNATEAGVGQTSLPDQEIAQNTKNNLVQITETMILGSRAVDETRFQFSDVHLNQTGLGNFSIPGVNVNGAFLGGGAPLEANFTQNKLYELQNNLTLTHGNHTIKAGGRLRQSDLASQSTTNFNGSWTFSQPVAPPGGVWCLAGIANPTSLDLYQQTQALLAQGTPMSDVLAQGCGPNQFTLNSGTPFTRVRQLDLGLFLQDDWRFRPNLTISAGLRYETQNNINDHQDWAPRVSVAWAPGAKAGRNSKTVIRGGWGIFYDRLATTEVLEALRYNGVTQQNYLVNNSLTQGGDAQALAALSTYPFAPPLSLLTLQNQALYVIDRNYRAPYMMQGAIGVERSLPGRTTLAVNLVNTRGLHVDRMRDINAFLPGTFTGPGTGVRPYAANNDTYLIESSGVFKQTQLMTNVNSRINNHVSLMGYYVYGQAHTNASSFPMNQYDANADWGRSNYDVRHRVFIGGNIGLPMSLVAAPFITMSSGLPFNITTGNAYNGDGIFNARPSFASAASDPRTVYATPWGAFNSNPASGETIIPYNYGDGPAQFTVNVRLSRTWSWGERTSRSPGPRGGGLGGPGGGFGGPGRGAGGGGRGGGFAAPMRVGSVGGSGKKYSLSVIASARNLFNHPNYGLPVGILTSPFFGESTTLAGAGPGGGGGGGAGGGGGGGRGGGGAGGAAGGQGAAAAPAVGDRRIDLQIRFQF